MSEAQSSLINRMAAKPEALDDKTFATANAIQVKIDNNIRMLAELHARWEREDKIAEQNSVARFYTITTTSNANFSHVSKSPTVNGKVIGVGNVSTSTAKRIKLPENTETLRVQNSEPIRTMPDVCPVVDHDAFDFDDCNISEVIMFLQKLARSPNASVINMAFTKHITNALMQVRRWLGAHH